MQLKTIIFLRMLINKSDFKKLIILYKVFNMYIKKRNLTFMKS